MQNCMDIMLWRSALDDTSKMTQTKRSQFYADDSAICIEQFLNQLKLYFWFGSESTDGLRLSSLPILT